MKSVVKIDVQLGDRVEIIEAQIQGIVVEHTEFLDGTHRWSVQYWNECKRETVNCEARELKMIARNEA